MDISYELVENVIYDVLPIIEDLTGWNAKIEDLPIVIKSRKEFWTDLLEQLDTELNVNIEAKTKKGKQIKEYERLLYSYGALAYYDLIKQEMGIIPENIGRSTNLDGLRVIIGHELVHRCQDVETNCREITIELTKKVYGQNAFDKNSLKKSDAFSKYQAYTSLIEGDASFVDYNLRTNYFARQKLLPSSKSIAVQLYLGIKGAPDERSSMKNVLSRYSNGRRIIREVHNHGGRDAINELYTKDLDDIVNLFSIKI